MELNGTSAIVTGAAQGIGAEAASELRARGADVITLDREAGADFVCDISDADRVDAVFDEIGAAGALDGLLNNAGLIVTRIARPWNEPSPMLRNRSFCWSISFWLPTVMFEVANQSCQISVIRSTSGREVRTILSSHQRWS